MRFWMFGAAASLALAAGGAHATQLMTGAVSGGGVAVYDTPGLGQTHAFTPYAGFNGGVRVAAGDVNGDGVADLITGAGPGGGPHVKVFDGVSGTELKSFFAFGSGFTGGVTVAAGDVNGDGLDDIVVGAGPGAGPHVKVFDGASGQELQSFFAYGAGFTGGVSVAAGDVNGDGYADIITGAGPGGGPHVKVFDGQGQGELHSFFAFDSQFTGGVNVAFGHRALGDTIIVGTASGAGHVKVFDPLLGEVDSFFAFDPGYSGGVSVGGGSFGRLDSLIVGQLDGGLVNVFAADRLGGPLASFRAFTSGVNVAGSFAVQGVPEPAAWALMILGFLGVGSRLRRRTAATA